MGWRESRESSPASALPELCWQAWLWPDVFGVSGKKEKASEARSAGSLFTPAPNWHMDNKGGFIPYVRSSTVAATLPCEYRPWPCGLCLNNKPVRISERPAGRNCRPAHWLLCWIFVLRRIQKDCSLAAELCFGHVTLLCLHLSLVKNSLNFFRYQDGHKTAVT